MTPADPTPTNACGGCTMCCDLMRVEMEPPKEARCACPHMGKRGCRIYDARPEPCREWSCLWLLSQDRAKGDGKMASNLRPDRTGVVVEVNSKGHLVAHCRRATDWRAEPTKSWLLKAARNLTVIIEAPGEVLNLQASGQTTRLVRFGVNKDTNEVMYRAAR